MRAPTPRESRGPVRVPGSNANESDCSKLLPGGVATELRKEPSCCHKFISQQQSSSPSATVIIVISNSHNHS